MSLKQAWDLARFFAAKSVVLLCVLSDGRKGPGVWGETSTNKRNESLLISNYYSNSMEHLTSTRDRFFQSQGSAYLIRSTGNSRSLPDGEEKAVADGFSDSPSPCGQRACPDPA